MNFFVTFKQEGDLCATKGRGGGGCFIKQEGPPEIVRANRGLGGAATHSAQS
jgi:hypothetical protein